MANFNRVKSKRLSDMVAQQIVERVAEGALRPGDPLPTEAALMKMFGVGRSTLREALHALTAVGIVETRRNVGSFIAENYANHLSERFKLTLLLTNNDITNIMEVRRGLELQMATLAAERASPEQRQTLKRLIEQMGDNLHDVARSTELDIEFHFTIAQSSGNPLLINLIANVKSVISDYIRAGNLDGALLDLDYAEHCRIYQAIQARSPQDAAQAMLEHLDSSTRQHLDLAAKRLSSESTGAEEAEPELASPAKEDAP
jgi:GntR family transcriptional repressor for pyruvate dehydrogenase complex